MQLTVVDNRSTAGSMNHRHQRPQVAKTNREELENGQQSTGVHCPQFQVQNQRTNTPTIQIPSSSTSRVRNAILVPYLRRDIDKIEKVQRKTTKMIFKIRKPQL